MSAELVLGADTLCWHGRLEAGEISLDEVLREAVGAGASFLQVNLHHLRGLDDTAAAAFAARAADEGVELLASGDFVGSATNGDRLEEGRGRVERWVERAEILGSAVLRLASGFYRAELAGRPDLIAAEIDHVTAVLEGTIDHAERAGIVLLLENHSDFTCSEYEQILHRVGRERTGVFLDLINAVSSFENPLETVERLAPLAHAGHVKDYALASDYAEDRYHRYGFTVRWCYPGEGVADLPALLAAVLGRVDGAFFLSVEGLDNRRGVADQSERLSASIRRIREIVAQGDVVGERR